MTALGGFAVIVLMISIGTWIFVKKYRREALIAAGISFAVVIVVIIAIPGTGQTTASSQTVPQKIAATQEKSAAPVAKDASYLDISLDDLKLDKAKLIGKKVRVSGLYSSLGDQEMLASEPMDTNPLWLSTKQLPRDQRKALMACADRTCTFEFEGIVRRMVFGVGIDVIKATEQ